MERKYLSNAKKFLVRGSGAVYFEEASGILIDWMMISSLRSVLNHCVMKDPCSGGVCWEFDIRAMVG